MSGEQRCPECGSRLTPGSAEGLCPRCLLIAALRQPAEPRENGSEPKRRIGPYRIVRLLGEGGMGMVYLAEQEEPIARQVALKIIKLGMDTRAVLARFQSEQQALALMDHPNIAQVHDAGSSEQGRPYFVMEYVPGVPITDYCDQHRLNTRQRLDLFLQVASGVQHAHQKGVIHRDLKPSNILVVELDGEAVPKIIDFGLARATEKHLAEETVFTEVGVLIGTPEYMSPEQAQGQPGIDTRADIYSLGVLLYELLVGSAPFDSRRLRSVGYDEIRRIIREDEPPSPAARLESLGAQADEVASRRATDAAGLRREIKGDLGWIAMKALEKDSARRYPSASEMAVDIQRHLRDEPVTASPARFAYRLQKFVRKNRLAVGAASAVAICLLVGLAVSTVLYIRAERQRIHAEQATAIAERQRIRAENEAGRADRERGLAERATASAGRDRAAAERLRIIAENEVKKATQQRQRAEDEAARADREAYASKLAAAQLLRREGQEREAQKLASDAATQQARVRTRSTLAIPSTPGASSAVEGRTVNDITGEPVPAATVTFRAWGGPEAGRGGGTDSFSTTSNAAGEFVIRGLPPAAYRIGPNRPGFRGLAYGGTEYGQAGQLLTLWPGQNLTGVELRLRPLGVITGRVIDGYGLPVYNVLVAAKFVRSQMGRRSLETAAYAHTNDLGDFRIFNVPPGRYWVSATPVPSMSASLAQGAQENSPEESYGTTYYPDATDPRSGTRVDVPSVVRAGINITLAESISVRVRGRVIDETGAVVPAAHVSLHEIGDLAAEPSRSTIAGSEGQFEFRIVRRGRYTVTAAVNAPQPPAQGRAFIDVGSENLDHIAVTVRPQFDLLVSLVIDGNARTDALLQYLSLTPALPVDNGSLTVGPPPKPQGTFTITGLFPDRYWLNARARPGLYIKSVRLGPEDVMGRAFDLTGGNSGTLHITVSANAGEVSGAVTDDGGAPLAQARVLLLPDSVLRAATPNIVASASAGTNVGLTGQDGTFRTTVAPGSYTAFAWADPTVGDWADWEAVKAVQDKGRRIQVTAGGKITLDLKAIPAIR